MPQNKREKLKTSQGETRTVGNGLRFGVYVPATHSLYVSMKRSLRSGNKMEQNVG